VIPMMTMRLLWWRAIIARHRPVIMTSAVGLLAIIAAAGFGASFVNSSKNSASLGMALAAGVAVLCYLVSLFILGRPSQRGPA
jgi:heme A synthase